MPSELIDEVDRVLEESGLPSFATRFVPDGESVVDMLGPIVLRCE